MPSIKKESNKLISFLTSTNIETERKTKPLRSYSSLKDLHMKAFIKLDDKVLSDTKSK